MYKKSQIGDFYIVDKLEIGACVQSHGSHGIRRNSIDYLYDALYTPFLQSIHCHSKEKTKKRHTDVNIYI